MQKIFISLLLMLYSNHFLGAHPTDIFRRLTNPIAESEFERVCFYDFNPEGPDHKAARKIVEALGKDFDQIKGVPWKCRKVWNKAKDRITGLNLSGLQLKSLRIVGGLDRLVSLNVSKNLLTELDTIYGLSSVRELDISDNCLSELSQNPRRHHVLLRVNIRNNLLTDQDHHSLMRHFNAFEVSASGQRAFRRACIGADLRPRENRPDEIRSIMRSSVLSQPQGDDIAASAHSIPSENQRVLQSVEGPESQNEVGAGSAGVDESVASFIYFILGQQSEDPDFLLELEDQFKTSSESEMSKIFLKLLHNRTDQKISFREFRSSLKNLITGSALSQSERNAIENPEATEITRDLEKLRARGVELRDIYFEELENYDSLVASYQDQGRTFNVKNIKKHLGELLSFIDDLHQEHTGDSGLSLRGDSVNQILANKRPDIRVQSPVTDTWYFESNYRRLKRVGKINNYMYSDFYSWVTSEAYIDCLEDAHYPEAEDQTNDLNLRSSHLILFLSSFMPPELNGTAARRTLGPGGDQIFSLIPDDYPMSDKPVSWYHESRYKLYRLIRAFMHLSKDQKSQMLGYFLHGGKHCSDAKKMALDDAYTRFCPDDAKRGEQKVFEEFERIGISGLKAKLIHQYSKNKEQFLGSYLNQKIRDQFQNEYSTYYFAGWDHLADHIGVGKISAEYPEFVIPGLRHDFINHLSQQFTAINTYRALAPEVRRFLSEFLGPLDELFPDKETLVLDILLSYGFFVDRPQCLSGD